jgi:NAD(P)-dependent dehydrogenase (short-subunit alcohol dehydrogenase family)
VTDHFSMQDKVVLVTGGSRGLGYEISRGCAAAGANVIVASRKLDSCQQVAREIEQMGRRALPVACHVGKWGDLDTLVETAVREFGRIDVLVNNAGMSPVAASSLDTTEELFDKVIAVNLKGPFRLAALVGTRMKAAGRGCIINVTSTGAIRPTPEIAPYAAAKSGLNVITRAQALEFGPEVRVNAIMAGPFWTDVSKAWREQADRTSDAAVRRIGRAHEIVSTVLYLASDQSSFTTGAVLEVSGGIR